MRTYKRIKGVKGLTLIEAMIASALLCVTLSAFIFSFVSAYRSALVAEEMMNAMHVARSLMEELVNVPYEDSRLSLGTHSILPREIRSRRSFIVFTGEYNVSQSYVPNTKDISLTLRWQSAPCRQFFINLRSSISEALHTE